jgi:site-specific recombinase XerD
MPQSLKHLKLEFLQYLEIEKNRALNTVQNYDFYLDRFLQFIKTDNPHAITLRVVKDYRLWLNRYTSAVTGEALSKRTQNYHMIAVRSFLKYLAKIDVQTLAPEKIELAKEPQREVSFLEIEEVHRLLSAPLRTSKGTIDTAPSIIQLRDKAILEMLFSTGLRVSELSKLTRDMVNLKRDEFSIRGKGGKLRVVFLTDDAKRWLKTYLEKRTDTSPFLFVGHDRAAGSDSRQDNTVALTPRSIQRLIQRYSKNAGITKPVTPHTMRHSFATDLLFNGADIRSVQALLGHSSITTTQVYTHVTDKGLKDVHKKFHGKNRRTV